jgi:IS5 family transposase
MKTHIGVEGDSGLPHAMITAATGTNGVTRAHAPLHRKESRASGVAGYTGLAERDEHQGSAVR